jgi:hypothetical protein
MAGPDVKVVVEPHGSSLGFLTGDSVNSARSSFVSCVLVNLLSQRRGYREH